MYKISQITNLNLTSAFLFTFSTPDGMCHDRALHDASLKFCTLTIQAPVRLKMISGKNEYKPEVDFMAV